MPSYLDFLNLKEYFDISDPETMEILNNAKITGISHLKDLMASFVIKDYLDDFDELKRLTGEEQDTLNDINTHNKKIEELNQKLIAAERDLAESNENFAQDNVNSKKSQDNVNSKKSQDNVDSKKSQDNVDAQKSRDKTDTEKSENDSDIEKSENDSGIEKSEDDSDIDSIKARIRKKTDELNALNNSLKKIQTAINDNRKKLEDFLIPDKDEGEVLDVNKIFDIEFEKIRKGGADAKKEFGQEFLKYYKKRKIPFYKKNNIYYQSGFAFGDNPHEDEKNAAVDELSNAIEKNPRDYIKKEDETLIEDKIEDLLEDGDIAWINATLSVNEEPSMRIWFTLVHQAKFVLASKMGRKISKKEKSVVFEEPKKLIKSLKLQKPGKIEEALMLFMKTETRLLIELGKECNFIEGRLPENYYDKNTKAQQIVANGKSIPKLLYDEFKDLQLLFEKKAVEKIAENINITPDMTLEECAAVLDLTLTEKFRIFKQKKCNEKSKVGEVFDDIEELKVSFAEMLLEKKRKDAIKKARNTMDINDINYYMMGDSIVSGKYEESPWFDEKWESSICSDAIYKVSNTENYIAYYTLTNAVTSRENIFDAEKNKPVGIFLNDNIEQVKKKAGQVDKKSEHVEKHNEADSEPIEQSNVRKSKLDDSLAEIKFDDDNADENGGSGESGLVDSESLQDVGYEEDLHFRGWMDKKTQKRSPEEIAAGNTYKWYYKMIPGPDKAYDVDVLDTEIEQLNNKAGLFMYSKPKDDIIKLGYKLNPIDYHPLEKKPLEKKPLEKKPLEKKPLEKNPLENLTEALNSMNLVDADRDIKTTHYLLWLLGTDPAADLTNLMEKAGRDINKRNYYEFCASHPLKKQSKPKDSMQFLTSMMQYLGIFKVAEGKIKNYKLPDIDYSNASEVKNNIDSIVMLRYLIENAVKVLDNQIEVMDNQVEDENLYQWRDIVSGFSDKMKNFLNGMDRFTVPLRNAYINIPIPITYSKIQKTFINTAKNRLIAKKRYNDYKGNTLERISESTGYKNGFLMEGLNELKYKQQPLDKNDLFRAMLYISNNDNVNTDSTFENTYIPQDSIDINMINNIVYKKIIALREALGPNPGNEIEMYKKLKYFDIFFDRILIGILKLNKMTETDMFLINGKKPKSREDILRAFYEGNSKIEIKKFNVNNEMKLTPAGSFVFAIDSNTLTKAASDVRMYEQGLGLIAEKLKVYRDRLMNLISVDKHETRQQKMERFSSDGNEFYQEFARTLEMTIQYLENHANEPEDINQCFDLLQRDSDTYYNKSKGIFFGPSSDKDKGRLEVSDEIRKLVPELKMFFGEMRKKLEVDYTFSSSDKSFANATLAEMKSELEKIDRDFGKDYYKTNTEEENRRKRVALRKAGILSGRTSAKVELLNLLKTLVPKEDSPRLSVLDSAKNYCKKKILDFVEKPETNEDDIRNISYLIKTGKMENQIEQIAHSRRFIDIINRRPDDYHQAVDNSGIKFSTLESIYTFHDVNISKIRVSEIIEAQVNTKRNMKNTLLDKYDTSILDNEMTFLGEKYCKEGDKEKKTDKINIYYMTLVPPFTVRRTAGVNLAIYKILCDKKKNKAKCTIEDLLDPSRLVNEKAEAFDYIINLLKDCNPENNKSADARKELAELMYNAEKNLVKQYDALAKKIDFNSPDFESTKEFALFCNISSVLYDVGQEKSYIQNEIFALAKKDHPEFNGFEDYHRYYNNVSGNGGMIMEKSRFIDLNYQDVKDGNTDNYLTIMSASLTKRLMINDLRAWQNSGTNLSLSQYSIQNVLHYKAADAIQAANDVVSSDYYGFPIDDLIKLENDVKEGKLFDKTTMDFYPRLTNLPNSGIKNLPTMEELIEHSNYNRKTRADYSLLEYEKLNGLKINNTLGEQYSYYNKKAAKAVSKLSDILKYDRENSFSDLNLVKNSIRDIIAERWADELVNEGIEGKRLEAAVHQATEYMMNHDPALKCTSRALVEKLAFTDYAQELVSNSVNGQFACKAGMALYDLYSKNYGSDTTALISDAAYASTLQVLRINGRIPNDMNTDRPISAEQYFNSLNKSDSFKRSLMIPNTENYKSPKDLCKTFFTDSFQKKGEIFRQENDVVVARENRIAAARARARKMMEEAKNQITEIVDKNMKNSNPVSKQ